jgi:hypothetical protein
LLSVILVSVVSAQTFFTNDRRAFRSSFRRRLASGAASGEAAAVTQVKEPADGGAGGYTTQEQTPLSASDGEYPYAACFNYDIS